MSYFDGRKADPIREAWHLRFGIVESFRRSDRLTLALMLQLSQCRNDEARRLILGISR